MYIWWSQTGVLGYCRKKTTTRQRNGDKTTAEVSHEVTCAVTQTARNIRTEDSASVDESKESNQGQSGRDTDGMEHVRPGHCNRTCKRRDAIASVTLLLLLLLLLLGACLYFASSSSSRANGVEVMRCLNGVTLSTREW